MAAMTREPMVSVIGWTGWPVPSRELACSVRLAGQLVPVAGGHARSLG